MKSHEINPGGGVILRNFIERRVALAVGRVIRDKLDTKNLPPIWMVDDICLFSSHQNGFETEDHAKVTDQVAGLIGEDFNESKLAISAVYNRSPITMFGFHSDLGRDVRTLVNVSEGSTTFSTITSGETPLKFDSEGWVRNVGDGHTIRDHELEPGDAYLINNLGTSFADRLAHATPQNAKGRTMMRYDQQFWSWRDNTVVRISVPDYVDLETIAAGAEIVSPELLP